MNVGPWLNRRTCWPGLAVLLVPAGVAVVIADQGWTRQIIVEHDQLVRMRDGVTLYADVYRPNEPGRFPALLMRTPYDKEESLQSGRQAFTIAAVRRGYVVVVQDARGEFKSEGEFLPYAQETNDGYDTIEWVAALPYVNGKVGTFGLSYPGAVQWMTAPTRPPHLVAMSPSMTFASGRHFFHYGGIFDAMWIDWLLGVQTRERRRLGLPLTTESEVDAAVQRDGDTWRHYVPLGDLPLMKPFKYWQEWVDNPVESAYWKPYDIEAQHHLVEVPALNLTGWNDDPYGQPGAIRNFTGMRKNGGSADARRGQRLIVGPWTHGVPRLTRTTYNGVDYGPNAAIDFTEPQLRFFDYWLRGTDEGYSTEAPVRIFVMGDNIWRNEHEWPIARTVYKDLFLRTGGRLDQAPAPAGDSPESFVYDPRNVVMLPAIGSPDEGWRAAIARRDVVTYTSDALDRDTEVTGQILGKLWVSSSAPDTDFTMRVLDVDRDGRARSLTVGPGTLRARYRSTEEHATPAPLPRTQPVELTIGVGYTSYVVPAGHRLQVLVAGSVWPNVHPNVWEPFTSMSQGVTATNQIHHAPGRPSRVILPVIPK